MIYRTYHIEPTSARVNLLPLISIFPSIHPSFMMSSEPVQTKSRHNSPKSPSIFKLEDQLLFYAQYHHNSTNIVIHLICVPLIFFTSLILLHSTPFFQHTDLQSITGPIPIPELWTRTGLFGPTGTSYDLNLATITSILYSTYFIILEPFAGLLYSPILLAFGHWSNLVTTESYHPEDYFKISLGVWTLSWIFQFIGHGHFEKRKPALVDNLFQSIVLAVFFVWIEALFFLGYRPKLRQSLDQKVKLAIAAYRAERAAAHGPSDQKQSEK